MYLVFFTLIGECTLRYFYLFNIVLIINMVIEEAKKIMYFMGTCRNN